ncbi:hypothetical protein K5I29_05410 [Flavobacterium agricola]|uniref:Secreted protein n=1 Tax=Flavobacterium agricola TaxID=2870839 RepID=A0ABY6M388_9FLAO|nr:hypothetical protein [Flavobacterium agricola]UYW02337.1 hypothetical protein K5I29_05410 [Flavobacterium agricola]
MKKSLLLTLLFIATTTFAQKQNATIFWDNLTKLCGQSFEGKIVKGGKEGDGFTGEKLVMHVMSCDKNEIRVPFHVGNNHSRTWVLTKDSKGLITLKHDHRKEDGSEDEVTQYGGTASNYGSETLQYFPADIFTQKLIGYAYSNVWWITLTKDAFSYNLEKIDTDRVFSVVFDLKKQVETPVKPWGTK